jgi:phasin family protein
MTDQNAKGFEAAMSGFSVASRSIQTFAAELTRMSKESMEHTTQLVEKLRGAKTLEEVVSIQSAFMQQSFASYADYTRRFGEMLTALPLDMAKQGRAAMQQGTETVAQNVEQAGHQVEHATDQFQQNFQQHSHNQY